MLPWRRLQTQWTSGGPRQPLQDLLVKGMDWELQKGNLKNTVGIQQEEYKNAGRYGMFRLSSYYLLGVPYLGSQCQAL